MRRILISLLTLTVFGSMLSAQEVNVDSLKANVTPVYTNEYLDTVQIRRKFVVNDYSLVGVTYGVGMNTMQFNPVRDVTSRFNPEYFGITYTRYGKLFGYMPYFGVQAGIFYGHEGYKFKVNKETGLSSTIEGANDVNINIVEVPALAIMHYDISHFKVMGGFGLYGAYRMSIERKGPSVTEGLENAFADYDYRLSYGLKGSLGFGLVFDPVEFHFNAMLRYGWGSLYQPDHDPEYGNYYYHFAYPFDIMLTAGVHFQLTKRVGKTKKELKREAYESVFGTVKK